VTIVAKCCVNDDSPYQPIGVALANLSKSHITQFHGQRNLGIGFQSCNSAVAVRKSLAVEHGYLDTPQALGMGGAHGFYVIYGSSRLYTGLDVDFNAELLDPYDMSAPFSSSPHEQHAEQSAITFAVSRRMPFWADIEGNNHVYVDFTPCKGCEPWLQDRPENWVVHYDVPLERKADHIAESRRRFVQSTQIFLDAAKANQLKNIASLQKQEKRKLRARGRPKDDPMEP